MRKWAALALISALIVMVGFSMAETGGGGEAVSGALLTGGAADSAGFARAIAPLNWSFPRDFGPHPDYQSEWWYYTGNLANEDGQRYGFQFTVFRRGLSAEPVPAGSSEWRSNELYMAHFTLTDVAGQQFFHEERFGRGGAGLAGATVDPAYRVWLGDWQAAAEDDDATQVRISARGDGFGVDLSLTQVKPPALQGEGGLSAKSAEPGNASYYYSLSRLLTEGTVTIGGQTFAVEGATWQDHEFSTSALGDNALGWDWFGLQLDDDRELMIGQIRQADGRKDPWFDGLLIYPDGSTRLLPAESFAIEATGSWNSPHTGAIYPSGWAITVDIGDDEPLQLIITPLLIDQELHGGGIAYWEGAVHISGSATGYGYAELTGYADSMTGRF